MARSFLSNRHERRARRQHSFRERRRWRGEHRALAQLFKLSVIVVDVRVRGVRSAAADYINAPSAHAALLARGVRKQTGKL